MLRHHCGGHIQFDGSCATICTIVEKKINALHHAKTMQMKVFVSWWRRWIKHGSEHENKNPKQNKCDQSNVIIPH